MRPEETIAQANEKLRRGGLWDVLAAKDMLLEAGFIRAKTPSIQAAFYKMFPPSKELARELEASLREVVEGDLAARRKAATYLEKQPRRSMNGYLQGWLKDPRTIEILCRAIDDADPSVTDKAIGCLGHIADRYGYVDLDVYRRIASKFECAGRSLRVTIAAAVCPFPTADRWPLVLAVLGDKPTRFAKMVLGRNVYAHGADMPEVPRRHLSALLVDMLDGEKNGDVFHVLLNALQTIGGRSTLDRLSMLKLPPRSKGLKEDLVRVMATIEARTSAAISK